MIEQFRSILGRPVTAEQAKELYLAAKNWHPVTELEKVVKEKISKLYRLANEYGSVIPKVDKLFFAQLFKYENPLQGLNGVFDHAPQLKIEGMNRPDTKSIYDEVNALILKELKKNRKWEKGWETKQKGYTIAYSYGTKKPYKGFLNQTLLGASPIFGRQKPLLKNPFYLTKKEIEEADGTLIKGAKPHKVFFFNIFYAFESPDRKLSFKTYKQDEMEKWLWENYDNLGVEFVAIIGKKPTKAEHINFLLNESKRPFIKIYDVYNGADVNGIEFKLDNILGYVDTTNTVRYKSIKKIPEAEKIIKSYPKPAPKIIHKEQDRAYYNGTKDYIMMPLKKQFKNAPIYYGTLFHELVHSTGHPDRLNRDLTGKFGSVTYAREELVAEMGSSYLSALAGFMYDNIGRTASYLNSWAKALTDSLEKDKTLFVRSAGKAQQAVEFIAEKYLKEKEKEAKKTKPKKEKQKPEPEPKPAPKKTAAKASKTNGQRKKRQPVKTAKKELTQKNAASYLRKFIVKKRELDTDNLAYVNNKHIFVFREKRFDNYPHQEYLVYTPNNIQLPQKPVFVALPVLIDALSKNAIVKIDEAGNIHTKERTLPNILNTESVKFPILFNKIKTGKFLGSVPRKKLHYIFSNIVSHDKSRRNLNGVLLDGENGNLVATDAHKMIFDKILPKTNEKFVILPFKYTSNDVDISFFKLNDNWVIAQYQYGNELFSIVKNYDARYYPDYLRVIPNKRDYNRYIKLKKSEIRKAVENGHAIAKTYGERLESFKFKVKKNKGIITPIISMFDEVWNAPFEIKVESNFEKEFVFGFRDIQMLGTLEYSSDEIGTLYFDNDTQNNYKWAILVDDYGLFMPYAVGLNAPGKLLDVNLSNETPEATGSIKPISALIGRKHQSYNLGRDPLGKFLGDIEVKQSGSIVATLDAPQGAGKTRFLFQVADMFARHGYKVLFFSLEEHPESKLFSQKVKQYISRKAKDNIFVAGEISKSELDRLIPDFDIILIDSWNKLEKEIRDKENTAIDLDYDLRKKFDGKFFLVVYQRTTAGTMRGGSRAQFDGDIILKIEKFPDFSKNYVYYDKNRYMIDDYVWNIYLKSLFGRGEYLNLLEENNYEDSL